MRRSNRIRTVILIAVMAAVFLTYIYKLMHIQIVEGENYAQQAQQGSTRTQVERAARGEIVDRYGRPLVTNRSGYNLIFDRAFLPRGRENEVILKIIGIMEESGEEWIDNLPITKTEPFAFAEGYDSEVARLKSNFEVNEYATCADVVSWMTEKYGLGAYDETSGLYVTRDENNTVTAACDPETMRKIAGVRYEMDRKDFSLSNTYTFASDVSMSTVTKVMERDFEMPGVDVEESAIREYVSGDIAPHIIGQVGQIYKEEYDELKDKGYRMDDVIGKEGIEYYFEDYLRGEDGERQITLDSRGNVIDVQTTRPAVPGGTVVTTLDKDLQRVAQDALEKEILWLQQNALPGQGREANAGALVAIENKTGDILAAVTYPSYDINDYRTKYAELSSDPLVPLWNRALYGTYAAGSTYKPSVALAGLTEGVITSTESILCTGVYTYFRDTTGAEYMPTCLYVNGPLDVRHALQVSCNIFFYETGRRLGIDAINKYSAQLGLGQPTGIEIGESRGQLSSPEVKARVEPELPWYPADTVQSAIGQLYNEFTPLQLANYAATIGNRGQRMDINIVRSVKSYTFEETIWDNIPTVAQEVEATPEAFETVVEGMIMATAPGGTSYSYWGDYPITIASKTGTPQTQEFPNSTYICFGPADDPEITVAVVIEKGWHGYTGAPVAKAVFDAYFYAGQSGGAPDTLGQLLQ